tara:strand:+ start:473 stop:823 length:351 start_codon:yes stop_codon:yes gene_type:complete
MTWMEILKEDIEIQFPEECCSDLSANIIASFGNTGTPEWNKWMMFVVNSTLNGECEEVLAELSEIENKGIDYFQNKYLNFTLTASQEKDLYLKLREISREYESCLEDATMLDHRFQ